MLAINIAVLLIMASLQIALLNSQNNWQALSRGEGSIIDFADKENQRT